MVRRNLDLRNENQVALALAELERIKGLLTRVSDGRSIVGTVITTTPTTGGAGGSPAGTTPAIEAGAHVVMGSKHTKSLRVTADDPSVSLVVNVEDGQAWVGGTFFSITATTATLADDTTNYVFVNNAGAIADNTTGFPVDSIPLAVVVTADGNVTLVTDNRAYLNAGAHEASGHVLLTGSTGQTIVGGTGADDNLTLVGSTDANEGAVIIDDSVLRFTGTSDAMAAGDVGFRESGGDLYMQSIDQITFIIDSDNNSTGAFFDWRTDDVEVAGTLLMRLIDEGQLQVPITGIAGGLLLGGDAQWYSDSGVMRTPDAVHVDGSIELDADLNHDGSNIGFFGTAPAAQAAAYTPTNVSTDRSYDADTVVITELADIVGTLIADLQTYGLLQ